MRARNTGVLSIPVGVRYIPRTGHQSFSSTQMSQRRLAHPARTPRIVALNVKPLHRMPSLHRSLKQRIVCEESELLHTPA
jgi:hypothetical protein